jgi:hypothetical protein
MPAAAKGLNSYIQSLQLQNQTSSSLPTTQQRPFPAIDAPPAEVISPLCKTRSCMRVNVHVHADATTCFLICMGYLITKTHSVAPSSSIFDCGLSAHAILYIVYMDR